MTLVINTDILMISFIGIIIKFNGLGSSNVFTKGFEEILFMCYKVYIYNCVSKTLHNKRNSEFIVTSSVMYGFWD